MKIEVRYETQYRYESEVSFSPHTFRIFPKTDYFVAMEAMKFTTNEGASVQHRRDIFDNPVAFCFYPVKGRDLHAELAMTLQLRERNAFDFLLEGRATDFPFRYQSDEQRVLAPYLQTSGAIDLGFWHPARKPTVLALVELNEALHDNLGYERRDEGTARSPAETVAIGSGACRDFAVLLAETLRGEGIAARLVSGFLCEFGEGEKRAEGAMHAWTEAYLPGAGWVGLDPTNGVFCNHNHITTAVGLLPRDVTPVSGSYYHKTHVAAEMSAKLEMIPCKE